ncbi:MAG: DUF5011 domain-containing protein [Sphingobacteriaceae bacterium]|nr:MAG: DUF5011 domain-containing protein [Sphingobacteriaceae bacterium]
MAGCLCSHILHLLPINIKINQLFIMNNFLQNHFGCSATKRWARHAKRLTFVALALLFTTAAQAQISGTKTVCASGCDYTTIAKALSDLKLKGINGKTTIEIATGSYNEQFSINGISGVSATNTVTLKGMGKSPKEVRIYNSTQYVVEINNISYIILDNIMVDQTGTSQNYYGIDMKSAKNCIIRNCFIQAPVFTSYVYDNAPLRSTTGTSNLIEKNTFRGGYFCINEGGFTTGSSKNTYRENKMTQFYNYGFNGYYTDQNVVTENYIDSASYMNYGSALYTYNESNVKYTRNTLVLNNVYYGVFLYAGTNTEFSNNMVLGSSTSQYGIYLYPISSTASLKFYHNTIHQTNSGFYNVYWYNYYNAVIDFQNNILSKSTTGITLYHQTANANDILQGNNYYSTGGTLLYYNAKAYSTLAAYKADAKAFGNTGQTDQNIAVKYKSSTDLHIDQSSIVPFGRTLKNTPNDFDNDARCVFFTTSGADESTYSGSPHYAKPSTPSFTYPSTIYDGNPTVFTNSVKPSTTGLDPVVYRWYVNGTHIVDSIHMETVLLTSPSSKVKLVAENCGGKDSVEKTITVSDPPAAPVSEFISDVNITQQGGLVRFTDNSTNFPSSWKWEITPAKSGSTPNYTVVTGSLNSPNMTVRFDGSGKFKVCLTASNKKGTGNTECKTDYIDVTPSYSMTTASSGGSNVTATASSGWLYDNGGPFKSYISPNNGITKSGLTIGGCSDSVFLVFTKFDIACGYDLLNVYAGNSSKGTSLQLGCTGVAYTGAGYSGGPSSTSCANWTAPGCTPKITDTFKAKGNLYIEMTYYYGQYSYPGFEAYYWTKKGTDKPPVAKFSATDSVCINGLVAFKNETVGNNVTYRWDLDGDTSIWEPAGANPNYAYFTEGEVTVTMIASNCSGSDTFQKKIYVFTPDAPSASFSADNTNPTLNDVVFLTTDMTTCVDNYKWTITSASGKGTAVYVNGTKSSSPKPQVSFTDTGCYSVELYTQNSVGDDKLKLNCFFNVKGSYCIPSVQNQISDVGISNVTLNSINNTSSQGVTGYTNYLTNLTQATTLEIGATFKLTVSRNTVNNKATRTVWIDWNGDGDFTDIGEKIGEELSAQSLSWSTDITVPTTAKVGATVMRIAINQGSNTNTPCGPNKFGEFEDYRIYIRQDFTKPVITLIGMDTVRLEQGQPYADAGATAFDNLDGDLTGNIKTVEPKLQDFYLIPDTYVFTYNVMDAAGNEAKTVKRIVIVVPDSTAPNLVVTKPDTIELQAFIPFVAPPVISANDLVDGDLTGKVVITDNVNNQLLGTYAATYTVEDRTGNIATTKRIVKVVDTIIPAITLIGSETVNHNVGMQYVDAGVVVSDNYSSQTDLRSNLTVQSNVDSNVVGTYTVVYVLKDPNTGRNISVTRIVNVVDTEKPMLTLTGDTAITLDVNTTLVDPGVKISDNYDKNLSYTAGGSFYSNFPTGNATIIGKYVIIYTVTDASGNTSNLSRTVNVVDRMAPEVTLIGDAAISVCRWATYTDSGMTVTDNYYKTGDITVTTEGTYLDEGTKMEGVYRLRYKAVDKSGNVGYSLWRYIFVRDPYEAPCSTPTSIGKQTGLDKLVKVYPNPNTGKFTVEANLPANEQVRISITNLLGQEVAVISNGALSNHTFSIDLSDQKAGVYMMTVVTDKQSTTKRIVITK